MRNLIIFMLALLPILAFAQEEIPIDCKSDTIGVDQRTYDAYQSRVDQLTEARQNRGEEVSDKYIPVIVNVIHSGEYEGVGSNLSDQDIEVAINVLNQSLRAGSDIFGETSSQEETHFYAFLATQDANGNPIDPIRRFNRNDYPNWPSVYQEEPNNSQASTIANEVSYNPGQFLNIHVMDWNSDVIGFANFPWWNVSQGKNRGIFMRTDGMYNGEIDYYSGGFLPMDYDHALTHEVGHYIGLLHTFESTSCVGSFNNYVINCETTGDDVCDTPPVLMSTRICNSQVSNLNLDGDLCSIEFEEPMNSENRKNFMDYVFTCPDYFFTPGQIERAHSATYLGRQPILENGAAIFASAEGTPGCIDPIACNYNAEATVDNGTCDYPEYGYNCLGECLVDTDGDGVCDPLEIDGCTDQNACNYNQEATEDDSSCQIPTGCETCSGETDGTGTIISNDQDDDGYCDDVDNTELSINLTKILDTDTMNVYRVWAITPSATDEVVAVYSVGTEESGTVSMSLSVSTEFYQDPVGSSMADNISTFALANFPTLQWDSWLTIGSENADDSQISKSNINDDLVEFEAGAGFIHNEQIGGSWYVIPGSNSKAVSGDDQRVLLAQLAVYKEGSTAGVVNLSWNIQWQDANGDTQNSLAVTATSTGSTSDVLGCIDPEACNYNSSANVSDGSCTYPAQYYDCNGDCLNDQDQDGVCDELEIDGCDDQSACNYNSEATENDGSCTYPVQYYDCNGDCLNDQDQDDVCDELEIPGCTDQTACNYSSEATEDDDSCTYPETGYNCDGTCIDLNQNDICDFDEFDCGNETVTYNGFEYTTALIGQQCWFIDNLRTESYREGSAIQNVTGESDWRGLTTGAWSSYDNQSDSSVVYGHLYNWYAVEGDSICPTGWHVPSDTDWQLLESHIGIPENDLDRISYRGDVINAAQTLKSDSLWSALAGNNSTGFNGLPSGIRLDFGGSFKYINSRAYWWTSTRYKTLRANNRNNAWFRVMDAEDHSIQRHWNFQQTSGGMGHGMSVRCVRD